MRVHLTPAVFPVQIPAHGGSFNYTIGATNTSDTTQHCDIWCKVRLPDGSMYGPVLGPITFNPPAGFNGSRVRLQMVPGGAPAGNYLYYGYVGDYPDSIWHQDSFPFTKLATGSGPWIGSWENSGQSFDEWFEVTAAEIPTFYSLNQNYPNPFNPTTTLRFGLPVAGHVILAIYNLLGQKVTTLVDGYRPAGWHQVSWEASVISSGIYFCRIQAGEFTAVKKMVLVK